jgi:hypothetical protein
MRRTPSSLAYRHCKRIQNEIATATGAATMVRQRAALLVGVRREMGRRVEMTASGASNGRGERAQCDIRGLK